MGQPSAFSARRREHGDRAPSVQPRDDLPVLDEVPILDQEFGQHAVMGRRDFVVGLHHLDQPERLARITETRRGAFLNLSNQKFQDWRDPSRVFEIMAS